jgi:uncharacterized membrane protein YraQ (UPF0718 family)
MTEMNCPKLKKANYRALKSLSKMVPTLLGVLLLISMMRVFIPKTFYSKMFIWNMFFDSVIGSIVGSVSIGSPVTGYILGAGFLKEGISLVAVTAFLVAWVTVGLIQLPLESTMMGKRFAIVRNLVAFLMSFVVAIITVLILGLM